MSGIDLDKLERLANAATAASATSAVAAAFERAANPAVVLSLIERLRIRERYIELQDRELEYYRRPTKDWRGS
jgi:hypothetical protein